MTRHPFTFAPSYRAPALLLGITPRTAWVDLGREGLSVRYGPWSLRTPLSNVTGVQRTGGFGWLKTAGPPHLSFADRGISFTTNGADAACVSLAHPVPGIDPTGLSSRVLRHPGMTLTVADVPGFITELEGLLAR